MDHHLHRRPDRSSPPGQRDPDALLDRLHKLSVILPALAEEAAAARRDAARLRVENRELRLRIRDPEGLIGAHEDS